MKKSILLLVASSIFLVACATGNSSLSQETYLTNRGYDELQKGNYRQAEANFEVALDINPDNPYALLNLGVIYQNTERKEKARELYQRVIALNPSEVAVRSDKEPFRGKTLVELAEENLRLLDLQEEVKTSKRPRS